MLGNSKAAKSARVAQQLRDKNGRWIEMGGLVKFSRGSDTFTGEVVDLNPAGAEPGLVKLNVTSKDHSLYGKSLNVDPQYLEAVDQKADLDLNESILHDVVAPSTQKSEFDSYMQGVKKNAGKVTDQIKKSVETDEEYFNRKAFKIVEPYTVKDAAFKNFPGYSEDGMRALDEYANEYDGINGPLRKPNRDEWIPLITAYKPLMHIIDQSVLAEPVVVHRALAAHKSLLDNILNNGIYFDKAFTSTSLNTNKIENLHNKPTYFPKDMSLVSLEIHLPAGFKAHKFDYSIQNQGLISRFADEEEVLLPPEVAFRVISVEKHPTSGGYKAVVEPILTKQNSVGVPTEDEKAQEMLDTATTEKPQKKKWWQLSMSAETFAIGTRLVSDNGIIIEKVSNEIWEYKTASNKISYNNRSIDCLKSIDSITFSVESN